MTIKSIACFLIALELFSAPVSHAVEYNKSESQRILGVQLTSFLIHLLKPVPVGPSSRYTYVNGPSCEAYAVVNRVGISFSVNGRIFDFHKEDALPVTFHSVLNTPIEQNVRIEIQGVSYFRKEKLILEVENGALVYLSLDVDGKVEECRRNK